VRRDRALLLQVGGLVAAGVLGGALALGGVAALGELGTSTTIREIVAGGSTASAAFKVGEGLTPGEVYRRWSSGVVQIEATGPAQTDPFDPFPQRERDLGSGFVFDKAGHIVTNYHVVQGAEAVNVSFSNDESVRAKLVGTDPSTDLAVLKVNTPSRGLTPLVLGRSTSVQVGDDVVAIGNPFGYERSMTAGIVSAIGRVLQAPNNLAIDNAIQTDAPINPGNSGGPLMNARGEVIGVNTQITTGSNSTDGSVGIGFAVPVDTVKSVAAQIIRHGKAEHAFLGIEATPITRDIARLFRLPERGLLVDSVVPGSAAANAGVHPGRREVIVEGESWRLGGDILLAVDGQSVATLEQLRTLVARKRPGDKVRLELHRGGSQDRVTVTAKLGRAPSAPAQ
jgi:S1-C subfamily serine protease